MAGHRSFVKQLLYPSTFSILYWWEIKKLSCRYKYFTQATIWFAVRRRRKHRTLCSVIFRERYIEQPSVCAYFIKMRTNCPLSNLNSNAQEFHVDVPLINFNWFDAWYNTNILQIWRHFLESSSLRCGKQIEVCTNCDKVL